MLIELKSTDSSKIAAALIKARRNVGSPAMGMVMTLIVVTTQRGFDAAAEAAHAASREHPCRVLLVVHSNARTSGLDAEIRLGESVPSETIVLRMRGEVADHPTSVLLPLLLPDSPVVAWWPGEGPEDMASDAIGSLANRRITDAEGARNPIQALLRTSADLAPGETDLAWTRITPWRALLAAAVDQYPATFTAAAVEAPRDNAPAALLAGWLEDRLKLKVDLRDGDGPGLTGVYLTTAAGDIAITRDDGLLAEYTVPGQPKRRVALKRRDTADLITEELRRMGDDDVYVAAAQAAVAVLKREGRVRPRNKSTRTGAKAGA